MCENHCICYHFVTVTSNLLLLLYCYYYMAGIPCSLLNPRIMQRAQCNNSYHARSAALRVAPPLS